MIREFENNKVKAPILLEKGVLENRRCEASALREWSLSHTSEVSEATGNNNHMLTSAMDTVKSRS
jgi:hypothetical protein